MFGVSMAISIQESITVVSISCIPKYMRWRQKKYEFTSCGLHYTTHVGATLLHIFTMTTIGAWYKLQLDTQSLQWKLLETESI